MAYPTVDSPPTSGAANGLDETGLLASVRALSLGPGDSVSASGDGGRGHLSERDYHGVRRGPFAVQRAAMALFASLLERRCEHKILVMLAMRTLRVGVRVYVRV